MGTGNAIAATIVLLFVAGLISALAYQLIKGRGADTISGFNLLSEKKKAKYDEKVLCRFVGKLMFFFAGCLILITAGILLQQHVVIIAGSALLASAIIFSVVYILTGNRFRRKTP